MTKRAERLLFYILEHPNEEISQTRLAKKLGMSPGQVHNYVARWRKCGLVKGSRAVDSPEVRALRRWRNILRVGKADVVKLILRHFPKAKGIGVYGSWAEGTNEEGSDLDAWVRLENKPDDLALANAGREIADKLGVQVDLTVLTPNQEKEWLERNDAFYFSIYHGIVLWGSGL